MNEKKEAKEEEDMECIEMCCPEEQGDISKRVKKILLNLGKDLEGRGNVVMTRLNDNDLEKMDALVEVEIFKSRSEAAAFFIKEGIQARQDLFQNVMPTVEKIRALKGQAKNSLLKENKSNT